METEINIEDLHFTMKNQLGEEVECDVLYEAVDEMQNKVYIAYTDYVKDEDGKNRVVLAELINTGSSYRPIPIEDANVKEALAEQVQKTLTGE